MIRHICGLRQAFRALVIWLALALQSVDLRKLRARLEVSSLEVSSLEVSSLEGLEPPGPAA
jgi:hypothetical protein